LQAQELEICSKVLGEEHPHTLTSMNNLAITWKVYGRSREALALMRSCVVLRERVLDTDHRTQRHRRQFTLSGRI
ncbi:hypothetical protein DER44DRAFT_670369, partial [Fusarium oxysporum]